MHWDAVTIGSIVAVAICVVIFVYVIYKVGALMKSDAKNHKQ